MCVSMEHEGHEDVTTTCQTVYSEKYVPRRKKPRIQSNSLDLISHLPDECIFEIFSFLPSSKDRLSCAAVSKKWLLLQANMRCSEFKSVASKSGTEKNTSSRCLEGRKANDTRLAAIAIAICPSGGLTELCIRGTFSSSGITDFGLKIISQSCPDLKKLSLWDCLKVTDKGLSSISHGCNSLEKLDLLNLPSVLENGLVSIAENCPDLSSLSLDSCAQIGDESLFALGRYSSNLKSLSVIKCPSCGVEGISFIVSRLPKLERLKLVSLCIEDSFLEAMGHYAISLTSLCLENNSSTTEVGFRSIKRLEKIEFLSIKSCSGFTDGAFEAISGTEFRALKVISVWNCPALSDEGLKELSKSAPSLETLKLVECDNVTIEGLKEVFINCYRTLKKLTLVKCRGVQESQGGNNVFRKCPLPRCPLLESLTLNSCDGIGDSLLSWLASSCLKIRHLELKRLNSITDWGFLNLLKALVEDEETNSLVSVDLSGCVLLTDWSVLALTSGFGEKIRELKLEGCVRISDKCLKMVADFCPSLVDLDISNCNISDDGVYCLAKSRNQSLEVLSLAGCTSITDDSLSYIQMMCGSLEGLNLKQCPRLSREEVESLMETLWWCELLY